MRPILPYFQLCRVPAVFSAVADIICGYVLTHPAMWKEPFDWRLVTLILSSCGLYLSGMVFNDVFDREIDFKERPGRPIPSGRVSLTVAIRMAVSLMVIGVALAMVSGVASFYLALLLTACILAYDSAIKNTMAGPIMMGSCRFLNILLGASLTGDFASIFAWPQLAMAACMGFYIVGVTIFSRQEAETSPRWRIACAGIVCNLGIGSLVMFLWYLDDATFYGNSPLFRLPIIGLLAIAVSIDRRIVATVSSPTPQRVQSTVKTMLMSLISFNAIVVFQVTGEPAMLLAVGCLLIPAMYLGRFMSIT